MSDRFSRTELLIGIEGLEKLNCSRVAVFGIGGVGGYAAEALARSGVGALDLIDNDRVSVSNINRQIIATAKTVGRLKVDVMAERVAEINPQCTVYRHNVFFMPTPPDMLDFSQFDYVIDAIDTVTGKLEIIKRSKECGVPVISCMGAGNKLDPTAFEVADISETSVCPLAKVIRRELKKQGISHVKVVYSKEEPAKPRGGVASESENPVRRAVPASIAFVPSVAGLIAAGEVIKDLIKTN